MLEKRGLVKLVEECGELVQIAAKKMAYMHTDEHPDGAGSMKERLEDEIADVQAICHIVEKNFDLDRQKIVDRAFEKMKLFRHWMNEESGSKDRCGKICATRNEYEEGRCTLPLNHVGSCYDEVNK